MQHFIYVATLFAVAGILIRFLIKERRAAAGVLKEKEEIEVEERRMFDFLRGLGEALQQDNSKVGLHRYIVNGVVKVIGADAGVLYVLDAENQKLVPTCQTERPAAVIPVPAEILAIENPENALRQLRIYIRLSTLGPGESFAGKALQDASLIYAEDIVEHPFFDGQPNPFQSGVSLLAAPLIYNREKIGVLAITGAKGETFSDNDRDIFEGISEQSSFALGSALIHSDANEKKLLEREVKQASEIQKVLLPRENPELSDYKLAASYKAARFVSGDYYDYIEIDKDHYGIAIGDVCGKGIPAALIVAMVRSLIRSAAIGNYSPADVLASVNQSIFPDMKADMFVSLLYLVLERGSNVVTMARAGHEPPLLVHHDSGTVELLEPPGMAVGVDAGDVFRRDVGDFRFTMEKDEILLLYTDGLIEASNSEGEEFEIDRLTSILSATNGDSPRKIVENIEKALSDFSGETAQSDDIPLIAVEKR